MYKYDGTGYVITSIMVASLSYIIFPSGVFDVLPLTLQQFGRLILSVICGVLSVICILAAFFKEG